MSHVLTLELIPPISREHEKTQAYTAQTLAEHALLAQAREDAQARTRAFKARLAKAAKTTVMAAGQQEEGEGEGEVVRALRAELAAVQRDMADIKADYEDRRPRMEEQLAKLSA